MVAGDQVYPDRGVQSCRGFFSVPGPLQSVQRAEMWGVILALQSSCAVHLGVDNLGVVRHVGRLLDGHHVVRLGGQKVKKARGNAADAVEAADVFLYLDSSIAPLLDMRRRFKAVMDVLGAMGHGSVWCFT